MPDNNEDYICPRGHRVFNQSYYRAVIVSDNGQGRTEESALTCMICQCRYSIKTLERIRQQPESTKHL